jgi:hypothetical protein
LFGLSGTFSPAQPPHERRKRTEEGDGSHHAASPETFRSRRCARDASRAPAHERRACRDAERATTATAEARFAADAAAARGASSSAAADGAPAGAAAIRKRRSPTFRASSSASLAAGTAPAAGVAASHADGFRRCAPSAESGGARAETRGRSPEAADGPPEAARRHHASAEPRRDARAAKHHAKTASCTGIDAGCIHRAATDSANAASPAGSENAGAAQAATRDSRDAAAPARLATAAARHPAFEHRLSCAFKLPGLSHAGGAKKGDGTHQHPAAAGRRASRVGDDGQNAAAQHKATSGAQAGRSDHVRSGGSDSCRARRRPCDGPGARHAQPGAAPRLLGDLRRVHRHFAYPDLELLCVTYG